VELLQGAGIEAIADVRRYPASRRMPWFNEGSLRALLGDTGIAYAHLPELGGRRSPARDSRNGGWQVGQFQGYADHMGSQEFAAGLERLLVLAATRCTAAMCAEAPWWRCHRRLLSDALVVRGWTVLHLGARGEREPHRLTEFAVVDGTRIRYPPPQAALDV
jgi:uncharacterized protein (DUF488 family)